MSGPQALSSFHSRNPRHTSTAVLQGILRQQFESARATSMQKLNAIHTSLEARQKLTPPQPTLTESFMNTAAKLPLPRLADATQGVLDMVQAGEKYVGIQVASQRGIAPNDFAIFHAISTGLSGLYHLGQAAIGDSNSPIGTVLKGLRSILPAYFLSNLPEGPQKMALLQDQSPFEYIQQQISPTFLQQGAAMASHFSKELDSSWEQARQSSYESQVKDHGFAVKEGFNSYKSSSKKPQEWQNIIQALQDLKNAALSALVN